MNFSKKEKKGIMIDMVPCPFEFEGSLSAMAVTRHGLAPSLVMGCACYVRSTTPYYYYYYFSSSYYYEVVSEKSVTTEYRVKSKSRIIMKN